MARRVELVQSHENEKEHKKSEGENAYGRIGWMVRCVSGEKTEEVKI